MGMLVRCVYSKILNICDIKMGMAIEHLVLEKKIFNVLLCMGMAECWSCDKDRLKKFSFPRPWRLHMKFGYNRLIDFRVEVERNCGRTDGR